MKARTVTTFSELSPTGGVRSMVTVVMEAGKETSELLTAMLNKQGFNTLRFRLGVAKYMLVNALPLREIPSTEAGTTAIEFACRKVEIV